MPNSDPHPTPARTSRRVLHTVAAMALAGAVLATAGSAGALSRGTAGPTSPVLVDTIKVMANGHTSTSDISLLTGVKYTITISGTASLSTTGTIGDAEYAVLPGGTVQDLCAQVPATDIGVGINSTNPLAQKNPVAWGAYSSTHHYSIGRVGTGAPIKFTYHDCIPSDNSGSVTAKIYATP